MGASNGAEWEETIVKAEMIEGQEAFQRFNNAMKSIIAVPHSVIKQRIEEHRKQTALNPNRRGPKRKVKTSV
jgi:hypothetical protein